MRRHTMTKTIATLCVVLCGCVEVAPDTLEPTSDSSFLRPIAIAHGDHASFSSSPIVPEELIKQINEGVFDGSQKSVNPIRLFPQGDSSGPGAITNATSCTVFGGPPTRFSSDTIQASVVVNCNNLIQSSVMNLYILRSVAGLPFELFASRSESFGQSSIFGVGVSRSDPVCLPADYLTILDITVNFRDGEPRTIQAIFASNVVSIGC